VRWLVRVDAAHVKAKKEVIEQRLLRGQIVCVQETHWLEHEAVLWEFGLLVRDVFWSAANGGASGHRRLGGVAIFLPVGYSFDWEGNIILVDGHAILATVRSDSGEVDYIVNTYLRPEDPRGTWNDIQDALPPHVRHSPRTVYVGDFNLDLHATTGERGEVSEAAALTCNGGVIIAPPHCHLSCG